MHPSDWYEESNTVCLTQGSVLKGYTLLNSVLVSHQKQTKTVANQAGQLVIESDVNVRRKETFGKISSWASTHFQNRHSCSVDSSQPGAIPYLQLSVSSSRLSFSRTEQKECLAGLAMEALRAPCIFTDMTHIPLLLGFGVIIAGILWRSELIIGLLGRVSAFGI